ncbi:MAG TPA: ribosome-associated translation inhibitor RaiA [Fimbriimonadaceae bacterium]|nr:ribosome-associated translation inhibitor RaiA [Fimbriimonadaceae bacterium]HRJ33353.1 ribosome-associated translation inhibitor RaiA [Fimbriimonadaceae bacterium]
MEVLVRNAEGNLPTHDREYASKKLGRLDRYFHQARKVEIVHREEKLLHHIEVTVFADHFTVRGEESDASIAAAIDKVAEKLENRLRRLKSRLVKNHRRKGSDVPKGLLEEHAEAEEEHHVEIKERKQFLLKLMNVDEAALQMDLLDHPFFVFRNEDNGNLEVLYKRKDGRLTVFYVEGA